jgi:hypothetical protein
MGFIVQLGLGEGSQLLYGLLVDGNQAKRCGERIGAAESNPLNRDKVSRAGQDYSLDSSHGIGPNQAGVGRRSNRPRINVSGMRSDERLQSGITGPVGLRQISLNGFLQHSRLPGVKSTGDDCFPDVRHAGLLSRTTFFR